MEHHHKVLLSNLDDGHISSIGGVLEIKAEEPYVFILVMPFLQIGKPTRGNLAIVGVGDLESFSERCKHIGNLMADSGNGGGGLGKKEERERGTGRMRGEEDEERASALYSLYPRVLI